MVTYKTSTDQRRDQTVQNLEDYIGALHEERKKIQVFERELPLCLKLVSQAIERCRQQMCDHSCDQPGASDECPVLEQFIPMKTTSYTNNEDIIDDQQQQKQELSHKSKFICSKDWLASAQLSLQASTNPPIEEDLLSKKLTMEEDRNGNKIYNPIQKKITSTSSSEDTGGGKSGTGNDGGNNVEDKGRSDKKERRCWSPELHRRFLHALKQLGGAYVATPKQIRELMKVNGLTNDEIKSHLQKYRLHTRRSNPHGIHNDTLTPQLMVVGRIWMPPLDYYTSNATSSPLTNEMKKSAKTVYAPIASLPQPITASPYKTKQQ